MKFWESIKTASLSKISAGSTIWIFLVPAIVKISNGIGIHVVNDYKLQIVAPQSFVLLYFSAMSFFLALMVYILFCPSLIKKTNSFDDFNSLGMNEYNLSSTISNLSANKSKELISDIKENLGMPSPEIIDKEEYKIIKVGKEGTPILIQSEKIPQAYWIVREFHNARLPLVQLISILLYITGILILIYILFSNLFLVINHVVN
ncbi:hypothetical protein TUM4438_21950 [Shewanella sairae]|uniref:Uncharacterized protein n=1 Tax=Shewanella sairae TaxID=190310 RepID=A0ABQ4PFL7_9GAMM|nr:hypothetical protein [Shewanella sairae]MCL1129994.1 hypothetical protein [Shewanella sairae]GIU46350.1 hypothetical protein TUM4438_21950 [Shewanella sairae]